MTSLPPGARTRAASSKKPRSKYRAADSVGPPSKSPQGGSVAIAVTKPSSKALESRASRIFGEYRPAPALESAADHGRLDGGDLLGRIVRGENEPIRRGEGALEGYAPVPAEGIEEDVVGTGARSSPRGDGRSCAVIRRATAISGRLFSRGYPLEEKRAPPARSCRRNSRSGRSESGRAPLRRADESLEGGRTSRGSEAGSSGPKELRTKVGARRTFGCELPPARSPRTGRRLGPPRRADRARSRARRSRGRREILLAPERDHGNMRRRRAAPSHWRRARLQSQPYRVVPVGVAMEPG